MIWNQIQTLKCTQWPYQPNWKTKFINGEEVSWNCLGNLGKMLSTCNVSGTFSVKYNINRTLLKEDTKSWHWHKIWPGIKVKCPFWCTPLQNWGKKWKYKQERATTVPSNRTCLCGNSLATLESNSIGKTEISIGEWKK